MDYKCDKKTLIEVLKVRPDYYVDKQEQKSLGIWTERIIKLMEKADEKENK